MVFIVVSATVTVICLFFLLYIPSYRVIDRESLESVVEFQPSTISKSVAIVYHFAGFASLLKFNWIFRVQSNFCGVYYSSELSSDSEKKSQIYDNFIVLYNIDMSIYYRQSYTQYLSVNDWFARNLTLCVRPIAGLTNPRIIVSACDSRVTVFPIITSDVSVWLKGETFSVSTLLGDDSIYSIFEGGSMIINRLAPQDYHWFHSPINGTLSRRYTVDGSLYSVNQDAIRSQNGYLYIFLFKLIFLVQFIIKELLIF